MSASLPSPHPERYLRRRADAFRDVPRPVVTLATAAAAVAWVPMFLLALAERFVGGRPDATRLFAHDFVSHVRFLAAIPLLVLSDALILAAFYRCETHLEASELAAPGESERLRSGIAAARRLRTSRWASLVIVLVVLAMTVATRGDVASWVEIERPGRSATWAFAWMEAVSLPIFRFVLLRWLFHWIVWAGFLFWMRRLDLQLVAIHPDRCGGLGFLAVPVLSAFGVVFGVSATAAIAWRRAVVSHAATVAQVELQILALAAVWLLLLLGPLVSFTPRLLRLKRIALVEYSQLGDEYTHAFHGKWLGKPHGGERLLGTPDIQSLADLGTSMDTVHGLRPTPIDLQLVLPIVVIYAIALLPVILAQLSLNELLSRLLHVVL